MYYMKKQKERNKQTTLAQCSVSAISYSRTNFDPNYRSQKSIYNGPNKKDMYGST